MAKYLVTGGAGFIGASLIKSLKRLGHEITTIDNFSTGFKNNLINDIEFIEGSCQDAAIITKLEDKCFDAIYHIAGQSSGEISFDDPVYDLQTNAQSTLMLLDLAVRIGCKKFIYASSLSVYGDKKSTVKESAILKPKSFYAIGKLASEHYLELYQKFGITTTSMRLCNVYGPGQNLENMRQGMVSIFISMAIRERYIHVKGDKNRFRDFLYIDDVVQAFILASQRSGINYKCYNIASSSKTKVETLIDLVTRHLNFPISVEYQGSTPGDQFGISADNTRANLELGWAPTFDLDRGIREMIEWALKEA